MHAPTVTLTRVLVGLLQNSKSGIPILPIVDDILHKSLLRLGWTQNPKKLNSSRSPRTRLLQALFGRRPLARFNAHPSPQLASQVTGLLQDEDPLVRRSAVVLQRGAAPEDKTLRLANLLRDSVKSVRIAAAKELIGAPIQTIAKAVQNRIAKGVPGIQGVDRRKVGFSGNPSNRGGDIAEFEKLARSRGSIHGSREA